MWIGTYNRRDIRYAADPVSEGEERWSTRAPLVNSQISNYTNDYPTALVGCQEVLHEQLVDILDGLNQESSSSNPEWAYIGVGRDDGKEAGEYSPIFYRPSIWTLENWTTIWLSPTPDTPSLGWDAGSIRIVTIGDFTHTETGKQVIAMNTHFDNVGAVSRNNSAHIIVEQIKMRQVYNETTGQTPVVTLTGDLNSPPHDEAYLYFTQEDSPVFDVTEQISGNTSTGTFTGFDGSSNSLLDHIFLDKISTWAVQSYEVLPNLSEDGVYLSDHRAVVSDAELTL